MSIIRVKTAERDEGHNTEPMRPILKPPCCKTSAAAQNLQLALRSGPPRVPLSRNFRKSRIILREQMGEQAHFKPDWALFVYLQEKMETALCSCVCVRVCLNVNVMLLQWPTWIQIKSLYKDPWKYTLSRPCWWIPGQRKSAFIPIMIFKKYTPSLEPSALHFYIFPHLHHLHLSHFFQCQQLLFSFISL